MKMNKTIFNMKSLLTVFIFIASMSVQAAEEVKVAKNNKYSVVIEADQTMKGDEVIIRNQIGKILYREALEVNKSYKKIFQFSLFDNGVYIISFENDYKSEYYNVIKNDNGIKLLDINNAKFTFKPVVRKDDQLAHVFLTNESLQEVKLKILDQSGEKLSSIRFDEELIIKRSFDLSKLPSGKYNLIIEVGEKSFTRVLNVQ